MAERSGFLTFIFVFYLVSAVYEALGWLFGALITLLLLFAEPMIGLMHVAVDAISLISLALSIIFIMKVWRVSVDLPRWTDIVHLVQFVIAILFLVVSVFTPELLGSEGLPRYMVWFSIAGIFIHLAFWTGIRTHLSRLEREGQASFSAPIFGRT